MEILRALRVNTKTRMAFVGAGGKTTALFQLAHQIKPKVIACASTHLGKGQLSLADHHFIYDHQGQYHKTDLQNLTGVILFTGPPVENGERTSGLTPEILLELKSLADELDIALLIEADGSRRLPIKAPADYEPAVPAWANSVVVVEGLSSLGKPLNSEWVHRLQIFSSITGLQPEQPIQMENILSLLVHPQGGLKNIPQDARRIALLNQADTAILQASAGSVIPELLEAYDAVAIASLNTAASSTNSAPGSNPPIYAVYERVAGILLAAGGAHRYGEAKLLLPWQGKPLIRHVAENAIQAGISKIIVVIGSTIDSIKEALADLPVEYVLNQDWALGQSTSIIKGLNALSNNYEAAIFLLGDQPQIPVGLLTSLIESHRHSLAPITAPLVNGKRSNPVIFDRSTFSDLLQLQGDTGGRAIFSKYQLEWVNWNDDRILLDVDTPEDYQRLKDLEK
ncbi:MAG: selenium cofactor biosynthesis protein YqeC [Anaerolineaceae bacterium]|nr:selenium cofactor biosynthesis protein YqeC [Anaerolineaceae bacterium]